MVARGKPELDSQEICIFSGTGTTTHCVCGETNCVDHSLMQIGRLHISEAQNRS